MRPFCTACAAQVLAVEELKKLVRDKSADDLKKLKPQVLEDVESLYTTHLLEAAPEHGNLGVSLEINLDEPSRKFLYSSRDEITKAAATDPGRLADFATLFDKQYKTNIKEIRQHTIPQFLKSPEYKEFQLQLYPLPACDKVFKETSSYTNWILKQKCKLDEPRPTPPPSTSDANGAAASNGVANGGSS